MRVHLLTVPNTRPTSAYPLDGFCTRTHLFATLLTRMQIPVFLYGVGPHTETPCDEYIPCLSEAEQESYVGSTPYQDVKFDGTSMLFVTFNTRAAQAIRNRKQPGDLICTIAGSSQYVVSEWHPELIFLEYSVGYRGVCAPFRIYQSHAWRHTVYGFTGVDGDRPFDDVIPPWFLANTVPVCYEPEEYVAYCGRLVPWKGLQMVCASARAAGVKLVVMGHGDPKLITYGEYAGAVSMEERDRILSKARAVLMPTIYVEPFGNVSAEAQLCGTPVIASNWGAFTESVEPGVSGALCNTLGEFTAAIDAARHLDRRAIRARAVRLYSEATAARAYMQYFNRLQHARGAGVWSTQTGGDDGTRDQRAVARLPRADDYGVRAGHHPLPSEYGVCDGAVVGVS